MFKNFGPVIFFCTAIIGMLVLYECKKSSRAKQSAKDSFWSREAKANTVRRKDISFLNYIQIPISALPFIDTNDDEITEYQATIKRLSENKILNLTGLSNTDLKEKYGVANLPELSDYDENYTTLAATIARWGSRLIALGYNDEAKVVLEYGISIGSDVSRNYYLLADIYRKENNPDKIDALIDKASALDSIMKNSIIAKLKEMKEFKNS